MKVIKYFNEYLNEEKIGNFVEIDGKKFPTKNSKGDYIGNTVDSIINFYKWFGKSITVDSKKRPIVFYHISQNKFDTFKPGIFGKMGAGIYFTSMYKELVRHNKTGGNEIYSCYLKIENPMMLGDNPFNKRPDIEHDGIIARMGIEGEEIKVYNSTQIKSIDNKGGWDSESGNVYEIDLEN